MCEAPHAAAILTLKEVQPKGDSGRMMEEEPFPGEYCTNPEGHVWVFTGTNYGGEDERYNGEGVSHCIYCGADGDA